MERQIIKNHFVPKKKFIMIIREYQMQFVEEQEIKMKIENGLENILHQKE